MHFWKLKWSRHYSPYVEEHQNEKKEFRCFKQNILYYLYFVYVLQCIYIFMYYIDVLFIEIVI